MKEPDERDAKGKMWGQCAELQYPLEIDRPSRIVTNSSARKLSTPCPFKSLWSLLYIVTIN